MERSLETLLSQMLRCRLPRAHTCLHRAQELGFLVLTGPGRQTAGNCAGTVNSLAVTGGDSRCCLGIKTILKWAWEAGTRKR